MPKTHWPAIALLEVKDLFGDYDYRLDFSRTSECPLPLAILYGDNGSGKTTLLTLLYHMLAHEPHGGHRTYVGSIPFRYFRVTLSTGIVVTATRDTSHEVGPYNLTLSQGGNTTAAFRWLPSGSPDKKANRGAASELAYAELCAQLKAYVPEIHFLPDNRKSQPRQTDEQRFLHFTDFQVMKARFGRTAAIEQIAQQPEESAISLAIRSAMQTLKALTLAGTKTGYDSANSIYTTLIRRLVSYNTGDQSGDATTRETLLSRLKSLRERNARFVNTGFTSELASDDLEQLVRSAASTKLPLVAHVLIPYLDGIQARLDALDEAQGLVTGVTEILNAFYNRKHVAIHLTSGVLIESTTGQQLLPEHLSSGEQQLLLLLCNAISARENASIFVIDEPELSLNVKWQRHLIAAILRIMPSKESQLILATHSIELLHQYSQYVRQLTDLKKKD